MRNLCYFCHYHQGDAKEKAIKLVGSFLIAFSLFSLGAAISIVAASEETALAAVENLPELGPTTTAETPAAASSTPTPAVKQSKPKEPAKPNEQMKPAEQPQMEKQENDEEREKMDKLQVERWKKDRLNEWKNFFRELEKVKKQIARLKGSQDEIAKLNVIKERVTKCQNQLMAATDVDAMRDELEAGDCSDMGEFWDEINRVRQAIEIPKELNRWLQGIKRLERIAKQKWAKKIVDLTPVAAELKTQYEAAKAAYQVGEFEDAWDIIREYSHEKGDPRECEGALNMIRDFTRNIPGIRNKELKTLLEELAGPVKEALVEGECREARETAEAIQREVGPKIFQMILKLEKSRKAIPEDLWDKIEQLKEKLEQEEVKVESPEKAPEPEKVAP